jgi:hypothetical protein
MLYILAFAVTETRGGSWKLLILAELGYDFGGAALWRGLQPAG